MSSISRLELLSVSAVPVADPSLAPSMPHGMLVLSLWFPVVMMASMEASDGPHVPVVRLLSVPPTMVDVTRSGAWLPPAMN